MAAKEEERPIDRIITLEERGDVFMRDIPGPHPDAPAVLLLHGLGATARLNWGPAFRPLSEHFRVLAIDHRGHGRGLRTRRFRLEDCADDAVDAAFDLGARRLIAVGYSMGGPIASLAWRRHPESIAGLVLAATARHFSTRHASPFARWLMPWVATGARLVPGLVQRRMLERTLSGIQHEGMRSRVAEELSGHDGPSVIQATGAVGSFSSHAWIGEVDVPTAVIVTTKDELVPPRRQRGLAEAIPGARVFEVEGDHAACVARADVFVPALVAACQDVSARAGLDAAA